MGQLTPLPIAPPPGVVVTESDRVVQGRWILSFDKVRFVNGRPQKIGGNVRVTNSPMSGTPRAIHAWRDFLQNQYVAAGTYRKLYAFDSSYTINDITPIVASGTLSNNPLTTTSGSTSVEVYSVGHGRGVGDTVIFAGATAVNGVTLNGTYLVDTIIDADHYTVIANQTATAPSSGGGSALTYEYELSVGTELGAYGLGYGVGPYGLGEYGVARAASTVYIEPRVWSLDHFGTVLLSACNGSTLFAFDPTQSQPWGRALTTFGGVAMNAPSDFRAMFVTPERYVFGLCDKMVVKACSQNDPTTWTPATTNTAFQRTLQVGTKLVGGRSLAPFISLIWTDAALYLFQYTGSQFVYNSSLAGQDCGLISPNAVVTIDGGAYWMGSDNFYSYGGSVLPMPRVEDIRKYVFDAVPPSLGYQCCAVLVPKFREIWFFYPTNGDNNPTRYVIYHLNDQCWSPGLADFYSAKGVTAGRASGTHFTQGDTSPLMAGTDGYIYNHDPLGDAYTDNGQPMAWQCTLSPYALQEGYQAMDVEAILLDFFNELGNVTVTVNAYDRINDAAPMDTETEIVGPADNPYTDMRVSGRYIGMLLAGSDLGSYFRFGRPVAWVRPSGRRS